MSVCPTLHVGIIGPSRASRAVALDSLAEAVHAHICARRPEGHDVALISGGAPGGDHVAVLLALHFGYKVLFLTPAALTGDDAVPYDPDCGEGRLLNTRYAVFAGARRAARQELVRATGLSTTMVRVHQSFKERNHAIAAESDEIVAFSKGSGTVPGSTGTRATWKAFPAEKPRWLFVINDMWEHVETRDGNGVKALRGQRVLSFAASATPRRE